MMTLEFPILESSMEIDDSGDQTYSDQENTPPTLLDSLPEDLIGKILSWVPTKTVLTSKAVSKLWLSATVISTFNETHFSRSTPCPLLVFTDVRGRHQNRILHLVEARTESDLGNLQLITRADFPDVVKGLVPLRRYLNAKATSCEGLVCWPTREGSGNVVICNPATREYVNVNFPDEPPGTMSNEPSLIGLGYSRASQAFELLKVQVHQNPRGIITRWRAEVCTVGSKTWRRVDTDDVIPNFDSSTTEREIFYVKGKMYWRYDRQTSICCFDFDWHSLDVISMPKFQGLLTLDEKEFVTGYTRMGALGDTLSMTILSPDDGHVEIWALRSSAHSDDEGWIPIHNIENLTTKFEHKGWLSPRGEYRPVMCMDKHKILMHDWWCTFLFHDAKAKTESLARLVEHADYEGSPINFALQVLPHVPRIIPLKETLQVEDESFRILKATPRYNFL